MAGLRATVTDMDRLRTRLDRLKADLDQAGKVALARTAVDVFQASQDIVPVDTGALKESAAISEVVELANSDLAVAISYGQGIDYAIKQHEDRDLVHANGSAKFLEIPFNGIGPESFERHIEDEIRKVLK